MKTSVSFVLALVGWLMVAITIALVVGRAVREAERDLRSVERFEHRPFRKQAP